MDLKVLGSSSLGNCYLLENDDECLVIEAGISFKEVEIAVDYNISKIVGVIVTHEHKDHSKYVQKYLDCGIKTYMSIGTYAELIKNKTIKDFPYVLNKPEDIEFGGFKIMAFDVQHDAKEPQGFYIHHKDIGNLVFITDSYYVNYKFVKVNHILVECNYKQSILDENFQKGLINKSLRERTMKSHFELNNVLEFIKCNNSNSLRSVILLHLSDRNSDEKLFKSECVKLVNDYVYVDVADKGLEVDLDLFPF